MRHDEVSFVPALQPRSTAKRGDWPALLTWMLNPNQDPLLQAEQLGLQTVYSLGFRQNSSW
jgi:hypothetical protein